MKGRKAAAWLLLTAAVGLAALGQYYFFHRREYLWDGLVFYILAAICFILAWRQTTAHARAPRAPRRWSIGLDEWIQVHPVPAVLMAAALFLAFAAIWLLLGRRWDQPTGDAVILWLLGLGAVAVAAFWPETWPPSWRRDWKAWLLQVSRGTWLEAATIAGLTAMALVLRVAALESVPFTLGGDEAWHGLLARQVLARELRNPFIMGYMSMPTFFYWPISWSLWLVGDNMAGLRLPAALVGALSVPVLYFFARRLWGRRTAFLAALFLATYDYHIHYSRLGANNVWDPLFLLLTLWVLDRGLSVADEGKQARFFMLAGLIMGLSAYFYTGARLLPPLIAIYLMFLWLQQRFGRSRPKPVPGLAWRWVVLMALTFLAVAGPMLGYALTHPNEWNARLNQVGIVQSGWLAREPGLTGKGTLQILGEQFLRSAGAFHVFPDRTVWYGADRPLLGFLPGIFAVLGMAWALLRWQDRRYFLMLIWFWSVIITGGMLTESPPSSQRLVIAIPAVALLVAFGLRQTVRLVRRLFEFNRTWENAVLGLLVVILAVGSVRFYFVEFTPARRYGSANGETATMIGHYLRELDRGDHVYFFGPPHIYWTFGTMTFLAPNVPGEDVVDPLTAPPDFAAEGSKGRSAVLVFLPERVGELVWVQQAFPGGHLREFHDIDGDLRFTVYNVP